MIKIRTKKEVVVDSRTGELGIGYCNVILNYFDGDNYNATIEFKRKNKNTGFYEMIEFDGENEFSVQQASYLEQALGVTGDTISERLRNLIVAVSIMELEKEGTGFGLGKGEFEHYEEETK